MRRAQIKSEGLWTDKAFSDDELFAWFKENTKDGAVTEDIKLFTDIEIKTGDDDTYEWTISDMSLDRDMERMDPAGVDLKNFKKNPVVLWGHQNHIPAIGTVLNPGVREGKVRGKVKFDPKEIDPFAWMIGQKVRIGTIRTGSVGFMPHVIEFIEDAKDPTRLIHRKWELLELSMCNIPANVNAMVERSADPEAEKTLLDIIERLAILEGKIAQEPKPEAARKTSDISEILSKPSKTSAENPWGVIFDTPADDTTSRPNKASFYFDGLIEEK